MSQDYELLREVWRKALNSPIRIPCGTIQQARRLRFTLYNSVKGMREVTALVDATLAKALRDCSVGFDQEDSTIVLVQLKSLSPLGLLVQDALGVKHGDVKSVEELAGMEALERMNKELGIGQDQPQPASSAEIVQALDPSQPTPRSTPYYTRGG